MPSNCNVEWRDKRVWGRDPDEVRRRFSHYGRFSHEEPESALSLHGLMAGAWLNPKEESGLRIRVGKIDAAILHDIGVPLVRGALEP